jgi:thioredoxin reductase (NADPH)
MKKNKYDVIIIGAGAAGMTAAIYTCRKKLKTLVITIDLGGQTLLTSCIENYPGYTEISGPKLMHIFEEQAKKFGAEFVFGKVHKIERTGKKEGFRIETKSCGVFESRVIILAYGKVPRSLGVQGEEKFLGRGVSTCATCDAPLFRNKSVAIVGGGNSALEAAELSSKFSKKVYLVHRRDQFRADEVTIGRIKRLKNVELVLNSVPKEIHGDKFVTGLTIEDLKTNKTNKIDVDGVFVEVGYVIETDLIKDLVELNKKNEIVTNKKCGTSCPGVFAAGDVTDIVFKQIVISAGEGAKAALCAYEYLQKMDGKTLTTIDWK